MNHVQQRELSRNDWMERWKREKREKREKN
jgi:hypothetical protein